MSTQAIEMVQNMVLDTIAPFIESITKRLDELEAHVNVVAHGVDVLSVQVPAATHSPEQEQPKATTPEPPSSAVEAVLALHRLDATPQQWVMKGGKREVAPEGLWEITCSVCKDHVIDWQQGDPEPPRCKTVQLLVRG